MGDGQLGRPVAAVRRDADRHVGRSESARPGYWSAQLRSTVRFEDGLRALAEAPAILGKEASCSSRSGPGDTHHVRRPDGEDDRPAVARGPDAADRGRAARPASRSMLRSLGRMWELGVPVDWEVSTSRAAPPGQPADLPVRTRELLDRRAGADRRQHSAGAAGRLRLVLRAGVATGRRRARAAPSARGRTRPRHGRRRGARRRGRRSPPATGARPYVVRHGSGVERRAERRIRRRPRRPRLLSSGWRPRSAPRRTSRRSCRLLGNRRARLDRPRHRRVRAVPRRAPARSRARSAHRRCDRSRSCSPPAGTDRLLATTSSTRRVRSASEPPGSSPRSTPVSASPTSTSTTTRRFPTACSPSSPRRTRARRRAPRRRTIRPRLSTGADCRHRDTHWLPEQPVVMVTGGLGYMGITLGESLFEPPSPPGVGRPLVVPRSGAVARAGRGPELRRTRTGDPAPARGDAIRPRRRPRAHRRLARRGPGPRRRRRGVRAVRRDRRGDPRRRERRARRRSVRSRTRDGR